MMKKRVLGILLSLALIIGMMPAVGMTAYADTSASDSPYKLWVGDKAVTSENASNITGSNPVTARYDAATNTLTLNNFRYEGHGCDNDDVKAVIKARMENENFTINLIGENIVKHVYKETSASSSGAGIYADYNVTITGSGTLTVSDGDRQGNYDSRGIRVLQNLTVGSGVTVNASSGKGQNSYGVIVNNLIVEGKLYADAGNAPQKSCGVYVSDGITVSEDGKLEAVGGTAVNGSYGVFIYDTDPNMRRIGGVMTARGATYAIARAAYPNPSINTAAIQYTIPDGYAAVESENYSGSGAALVAAGGKTSAGARYVRVGPPVPVTGMSLNKTSTTLTEGGTETLTAAVEPEDAIYPGPVWETTDPGVATVSDSGVVTAVAAGKAIITVTTTNGTDDTDDDKSATCEVTVNKKQTPAPPSDPTAVGTTHNVGGSVYAVTAAGAVSLRKAPNKKSVTIPAAVAIRGKSFNVTGINSDAFRGTKVKTLTVRTKLLTKSSVRGSLKGSKVKTVKVKVGKKKENKKYVKKYKKFFTKKNAGRKAKVK